MPEPIVVRKRRRTPYRRPHGAWKVAFADFVTAMMALFLVMWMMSSGEQARLAVAAYFEDPRGYAAAPGDDSGELGRQALLDRDELGALAAQIQDSIEGSPDFEGLGDHVAVELSEEGLRIELLENEEGLFFQSGSPSPTSTGRETIRRIVDQLRKLPNDIVLEGHTDARAFRGRNDYSNWELSADRANSARRILTENGVSSQRIAEVRGFAAVQLRRPEAPEDASNRRVSLIVRYDD